MGYSTTTITFCGWFCLKKHTKDLNEQKLPKDKAFKCDQCGKTGTIYHLEVCPKEADVCSWKCLQECVEAGCPWSFSESDNDEDD